MATTLAARSEGPARTQAGGPGRERTAGLPGGPALVAVGHGSRDPRAAATVRELLAAVRLLRPGLDVRLGHIELSPPLLADTLAGPFGPQGAVLVPLLLGRGYHVRHDLPGALAAAPGVRGTVAAPLGPHPLLAAALHDRLTEAGWDARGEAVVLAAAGSRDPDSARDAEATAALLAARLGVPVVPGYVSAAAPTVPQAVASLAARGLRRIAVASYFTAPGRFATQAAAASPWIASHPLGAHPALAALVLTRYTAALAATRA
jgi:sirohydrochlorin ferrochelatase